MKVFARPIIATLLLFFSVAVPAQTLQGAVDWNRRVSLGFGLSGQVKVVTVQAGDAVVRDGVLAELDATLFQIALDKAANTEKLSQVEMEGQQADFEREQTLFDEGSLSTVQLELEALELVRAESAYRNAQLERQAAQYLLGLARLKAPFNAWVIESGFSPGQFVNPDSDESPEITLAERGRYLAKTRIDGQAIGAFSGNPEVRVRIGDRIFEAISSHIGLEPVHQAPDQAQYSFTVEFATDELIRPGTPCTVVLP
ncbi:MAG: hypothetical protein GY889_01215 [Proteobacteria bacterium]|nr:hypothetical protein [Pseudomonadota bacterium]